VLQLEQRDQRSRTATDAVEQRHHLRHLGHLHPPGADETTGRADRDRSEDQRHVVEVEVEEDDQAADHRRGRPDEVAHACRAGAGESLERQDEADGAGQVDQLHPDRSPRLSHGPPPSCG
jgi:hypothetical protein